MTDQSAMPLASAPFLRFDASGRPGLHGVRCAACGTVIAGAPAACPCCCARDTLTPFALAERGRVHTGTVVHRSFPGVRTPFVAVVVDLDGGGTIKGTLVDVAPEAASIVFDMPVRVVYRDTGQRAADGRPYLSYYFVPGDAQ